MKRGKHTKDRAIRRVVKLKEIHLAVRGTFIVQKYNGALCQDACPLLRLAFPCPMLTVALAFIKNYLIWSKRIRIPNHIEPGRSYLRFCQRISESKDVIMPERLGCDLFGNIFYLYTEWIIRIQIEYIALTCCFLYSLFLYSLLSA